MQPDYAEIQKRSYFIWEREGRPSGRDWHHWFEAEAQLAHQHADERPSDTPSASETTPAAAAPTRSNRKKGSATIVSRKPRTRS